MIDEIFNEKNQQIIIPLHGTRINIICDTDNYTYPIQLIKQYFPANHIYHSNESESLSSAELIVCIAALDKNNHETLEPIEGAFLLKTGEFQKRPALLIKGSGISGIVYAINELGRKHLTTMNGSFQIPPLNIYESPSLPYRFFWTWDHSTNWYLEQTGMQEMGFANPYSKPAEGFLQDYYRLIDFMSLNRINGLTIYGFLRDSHGGIETAQQLCRYATERGVRIFPGVGINCYGGIYWEGAHQYNLSTWLEKNPELRAQFKQLQYFELPEFAKLYIPKTPYLDAACPSKARNHDYHVEAIQWLAETFQIGGINFETGDYGTCQCSDCLARRSKDQQWSIHDMAMLYPRLFSAAKQARKDMWMVCETYWDNLLDLNALAPLADLPHDAIYQFCINRSYWKRFKNELTPEHVKQLPQPTNILRTHMGSQWQHERYDLIAERYAEMMKLSYSTGLKGATIFGESSAFNTANEINYLAFARFGYDATLTWNQFVKDDLAPLFGDFEAAKQYLKLLNCEKSIPTLKQAIGEAHELSLGKKDDVHRRWTWLQNHLYQKLAMSNH